MAENAQELFVWLPHGIAERKAGIHAALQDQPPGMFHLVVSGLPQHRFCRQTNRTGGSKTHFYPLK
jgi:hypothetical protein